MKIEISEKKDQYKKNIIFNEKLAKYSWFNLGGLAETFFRPDNIEDLSHFFKNNSKDNINILGAGSNTLIRDGGVKGITIKLSSKFSFINLLEDNIIHVGASTLDKKLSNFASENSISGFEFLSCIPGTIGGGIIMNSGCYGGEISDLLVSAEVMDKNGNISQLNKQDIKFFYRGCNLKKNQIILSAKFKGILADKNKIKKKQLELIEKKKSSQPSQIKTCGSTFKNPDGEKAWKLIKETGSDKLTFGNAKVSEKHCNFFINDGHASSFDIEELIKQVKKNVLDKTGIELQLELKIIGTNS